MFNDFFTQFLLAFIPLFVALDALGTVPFFVYYTQNAGNDKLKRIVLHSVFVAFIIGIAFVFVGEYVLKFLGITVSDFKIAGGLLLLIFSIQAVSKEEGKMKKIEDDFSVVPLAIPLMIGPAVLTTLLIFKGIYRLPVISLALAVNLIIAAIMFRYSGALIRILGKDGMKAVGKISGILLAAIAVMLIRKGVLEFTNPWL
ncbi:MAG: MarC family protein [Candidatus Firestonebacteria bacterium]